MCAAAATEAAAAAAIRLHTIYREVSSERESSYKVIQKIKCVMSANVLNASEQQQKSGLWHNEQHHFTPFII